MTVSILRLLGVRPRERGEPGAQLRVGLGGPAPGQRAPRAVEQQCPSEPVVSGQQRGAPPRLERDLAGRSDVRYADVSQHFVEPLDGFLNRSTVHPRVRGAVPGSSGGSLAVLGYVPAVPGSVPPSPGNPTVLGGSPGRGVVSVHGALRRLGLVEALAVRDAPRRGSFERPHGSFGGSAISESAFRMPVTEERLLPCDRAELWFRSRTAARRGWSAMLDRRR